MSKHSLFSEQNVLQGLSGPLRVQISMHVHRDLISSVRWLAESDRRLVSTIVGSLQPLHVSIGD